MARCRIKLTGAFEELLELARIQITAAFVDIHKLRQGAYLGDRFSSRQKVWGGGGDGPAALDAYGRERKAQRIRATGHPNTIFCAEERGEVSLELLAHRPANESPMPQRCPEDTDQLFLEFLVR